MILFGAIAAGLAVLAAMLTMATPVLVHARNDFLLLTMDQIVNNAAKWRYMSGGKLRVPFTIRAIIGRGWGQGAQHSQSLQAQHQARQPIHAVIADPTPCHEPQTGGKPPSAKNGVRRMLRIDRVRCDGCRGHVGRPVCCRVWSCSSGSVGIGGWMLRCRTGSWRAVTGFIGALCVIETGRAV